MQALFTFKESQFHNSCDAVTENPEYTFNIVIVV